MSRDASSFFKNNELNFKR